MRQMIDCWLPHTAARMSRRPADTPILTEDSIKKRHVNEALQAFQNRLGKEGIPVAIIRPTLRTINESDIRSDLDSEESDDERPEVTDVEDSEEEEEIERTYEETLEELDRISRPLELSFSDEESGWETSLPSIEELPDLDPEPEYIYSSPVYSDSDPEYEL